MTHSWVIDYLTVNQQLLIPFTDFEPNISNTTRFSTISERFSVFIWRNFNSVKVKHNLCYISVHTVCSIPSVDSEKVHISWICSQVQFEGYNMFLIDPARTGRPVKIGDDHRFHAKRYAAYRMLHMICNIWYEDLMNHKLYDVVHKRALSTDWIVFSVLQF